ncbi:hypothetical protein EJB05_13928, partial [Eragrostis curvula]
MQCQYIEHRRIDIELPQSIQTQQIHSQERLERTVSLAIPRARLMRSVRKHGHRGEETMSPSSHVPWNRTRSRESSVSLVNVPEEGKLTAENPRLNRSISKRDTERTVSLATPQTRLMSSFRKHGHRGEETMSPSSHVPWNRTRSRQSSVSLVNVPEEGNVRAENPRSRSIAVAFPKQGRGMAPSTTTTSSSCASTKMWYRRPPERRRAARGSQAATDSGASYVVAMWMRRRAGASATASTSRTWRWSATDRNVSSGRRAHVRRQRRARTLVRAASVMVSSRRRMRTRTSSGRALRRSSPASAPEGERSRRLAAISPRQLCSMDGEGE